MEIAAKQRDIIAKRWFCDFNVRGESEHMRLDKYLKVSRLIKRRPVANEACDAGRIQVNGKVAKASLNVKVGDTVEPNGLVCILEAMKMENEIFSEQGGKVISVNAPAGTSVQSGDVIVTLG